MRIIAGKHKGLILKEFNTATIRPTLDRVRESVFNKIQFDVAGASVLDLFGGTGAVSLEFISRGAHVITGDISVDALKLIKLNFAKAKETPTLISGDYAQTLRYLQGKTFDFIYLDPPYATDFGEDALRLIDEYSLLKPSGMVIYEHMTNKKYSIPSGLKLIDKRKYGATQVSFIGVNNA